MFKLYPLLLAVLVAVSAPVLAAKDATKQDQQKPASAQKIEPKKSVTQGSVTVDGERIDYKAIAGLAILKNLNDKKNAGEKPIASMSYVAYVKRGVDDPSQRPITFLYNGGPGSSTMWLHMLAFGPQRVVVGNGEMTSPPPYEMVNNENSLLDVSDLVFIDAPGTGFGRVIGEDQGGVGKPEDVFGIDADAQAFAQFITWYLTEYGRWNSPKYLFGESYGTTRSAVLANILTNQENVGLNGVMLLSAILNFSLNVDFSEANPGVNVSYATGLPSYAATAFYHQKLPGNPADLTSFLDKVEAFAMTDYLQALNQGADLDEATKQGIAEQMHQYTGLPVEFILEANLRVSGGEFSKELLDEEDAVAGRLDSRYRGPALDPLAVDSMYDPMMSAISAPTVAMFNRYIRHTLKFGEDMIYKPSANVFRKWKFQHQPPGAPFALPFTPNVMPDLKAAMVRNPNLEVLLTGGYFDLGTTYYAAIYSMDQLGLPVDLQDNIHYAFYPAGHMMYLNPESHDALHDVTAEFIESTYTPN